MGRYRRSRVSGGTYFFTVTLRDRRSDLLVRRIDALRDAWRAAKVRTPHRVVAAVVLPDHLHAVVEMHDGRDDYSRLWQDIKKGFTKRIRPAGALSPWQGRFWEHTLRDDVDYVHINPMKHGLVDRVGDWPHSSFHRYVREGAISADWAGVAVPGAFGES